MKSLLLNRIVTSLSVTALSVGVLTGCSDNSKTNSSVSDASNFTRELNNDVGESLQFTQSDYEQARRGLIAKADKLRIVGEDGTVIWNRPAYDFITGEAPDTVNPSLWRQAELNNINGLFEVKPGIYQLRGFDLSNMTLIQGKTGWIVVDPLTAKETAAAAFEFAMTHLDSQPISAILYTHSHLDHFGGVMGVIDEKTIEENNIPVIAPEGFMEEATSENIIAGTSMSRRAIYMYGEDLPRSATGHVGSGLGKSPAFGTFGLIEPNTLVSQTPTEMMIDGVPFIFQYTPESEAPAEFTFYLPEQKVFGGGEVVSRNMHNLYTLRGAKVRDALKWSGYIEEARNLFSEADTYMASHHWPIWGQNNVQTFLKEQRDTYKYIHDQTVRAMNSGMTPAEIAETISLPESLTTSSSNRGYYGTVKHNAKAVYQGYLGWYDGNPAHLDPLPESVSAERYVRLAGGAENLLKQARKDFEAGDYRWVAEIVNRLVFAEPDNKEAKELLAKTYDQLGYQAESGPWRDVYLSAAFELRNGKTKNALDTALMKGILMQTPINNFFDSMAVRLKAEDATGKNLGLKINFSDLNESYYLWLENSVLHHRKAAVTDEADATLTLTHELFVNMLVGRAGIKDTLFSDQLTVDGSILDLVSFFALFEKPDTTFAIVTPD